MKNWIHVKNHQNRCTSLNLFLPRKVHRNVNNNDKKSSTITHSIPFLLLPRNHIANVKMLKMFLVLEYVEAYFYFKYRKLSCANFIFPHPFSSLYCRDTLCYRMKKNIFNSQSNCDETAQQAGMQAGSNISSFDSAFFSSFFSIRNR